MLTTDKPAVSIVMPTYNRANLIAETVNSVIAQTFKNWELIIIDDGSTDNTSDVLLHLNDQRIQYLFFPHSGMLGKLRNIGIKLSKGQFIAFLDSDDVWAPDKLDSQISELVANPNFDYCLTNAEQFGDGAVITNEIVDQRGNLLDAFLLKNKFTFFVASLIFRCQVVATTGLLNEHYRLCADIDFFIRMIANSPGVVLQRKLVKIRKHSGSTCSKLGFTAFEENLKIVNDLHEGKIIDSRQLNELRKSYYYKMGMAYSQVNDKGSAIRSFAKYAAHSPLDVKGYARIMQTLFSW
jgi:glycosyltransferase involved in cell wall biosynthesis